MEQNAQDGLMHLSDWLTIIAIVLAPVVAVQVQKWIERYRFKQGRRLWIFETLMTTRSARLAQEHVPALNMIDIAFDPKKSAEKAVITAWKLYRDHLNILGPSPSPERLQSWSERGDDLFAQLLVEMSKCVGYKFEFDTVDLKRSAYSPQGHAEEAVENQIIRKGLVQVLRDEDGILVKLVGTEEAIQRNSEYQNTMQEYMTVELAKARAKELGDGTVQKDA